MTPTPTTQPPPAPTPAPAPAADTAADAQRRKVERAVFERRKPPEADLPATPKPLGRS